MEKNVVVVIDGTAKRMDHFSFPQDRCGYDYFMRRMEELRHVSAVTQEVVAIEPVLYMGSKKSW